MCTGTNFDIQSLLGPNISAKTGDLATYMASNMVRVRAHVGRHRGIVPMPEKQLGMKEGKLGQAGKNFYSGHVQAGRLSIIPLADEQNFSRLEAQLRNAIHKMEVCDGLIPVAAYNQLKQNFSDIRDEYMAARDDVLSRWDTLVEEFKAGAAEMLKGVRMQQRRRDQLYKTIIAGIPSKNTYSSSFSMALEVTAFPATAAPNGLTASIAADVENSWSDTVVSTALKAIETSIGEGFALLGKAASAYENKGAIGPKTLNAMERYGSDLVWKNVFHNPALTSVSKKLAEVNRTDGVDAKQILVEEAILDLWKYAKENRLNLDVSVTPYDVATLDSMLQIRDGALQRQRTLFDSGEQSA